MRDTAVATAIVITCFALETFLFSIGWNLALPSIFNMKQITIAESLGLVIFLKIAGLQFFPVGALKRAIK
jgi:hypothetical protein